MTTFKNRSGFTDREVTIQRTLFSGQTDTLIEIHEPGQDLTHTTQAHMYMEDETAHALAAWILENVPKPAPKPLPRKFAAVVKSAGKLYTLGDTASEPRWVRANSEGNDWAEGKLLQAQGFEVIFAGVDTEGEA